MADIAACFFYILYHGCYNKLYLIVLPTLHWLVKAPIGVFSYFYKVLYIPIFHHT